VATPPAPWPAALSERSARLLAGRPRPATVLAAFPRALYLHVDDTVLPVVTPAGLRLPTALLVTAPAALLGWGVQPGDTAAVGDDAVVLPEVRMEVRRTWRPRRMPSAPAGARVPAGGPGDAWQVEARSLVTDALAQRPVDEAVRTLVGSGAGLTPSGDDVLCGALLGLRLAGESHALERVRAAVLPRLGATTTLSAALLREAGEGYAVPDLVRLGAALAAGDSDGAARATRAVLAVGHSSGRDLLAGLWGALEATGLATARRAAVAAVPSEGALG